MTTTDDVTTADQSLFLATLDATLSELLMRVIDENPKMDYTDVIVALTKDAKSFSQFALMPGSSFHPIDSHGDKTIIVYSFGKLTGYGLYDEDSTTCYQLSIDELAAMYAPSDDELLWETYSRARRLVDNLEKLLIS